MNNKKNIKFNKEKKMFGIWSIMNNPGLIDIASNAGLDFIILDLEHGIIDITLIENCIRACEATNTFALVRVPEHDSFFIQTVIDLGAHGVVAPQIKNFKDAENFVQKTKLYPNGIRGFNPFTRAGGYNPEIPIKFTKLSNDFLLTAIILENQNIIQELDLILNLNDLDLLYIGVYDLAVDMGFAGNANAAEIKEKVLTLIKIIKKSKKMVGLMVKNREEMQEYLNYGVDVFLIGVDTYLYYSCVKNQVDTFKSIMGHVNEN